MKSTTGFPTFAAYFEAVHGRPPFPWQQRLAEAVLADGWPAALGLPTASGKTATLDVATWALACEAAEGTAPRRMPRRIVLVVDRRIVVDDAFERAKKIAAALKDASGGPLIAVRDALRELGGEVPIHATVLRGAIHRDERWARTPSQPTLAVSTVDQVGSRLLFRGYGLSPGAQPIHAGLLANDTLLILDEAHLSRPFEETLEWIAHHRKQGEQPLSLPFAFVRMTATPPPGLPLFKLADDDRKHPVLARRLAARKPAVLEEPLDRKAMAKRFADLATKAAAPGRTIAVVVNRVALAREILEVLQKVAKLQADLLLLTGRSRSHERDAQIDRHRDRLASGRDRDKQAQAKPLIVVATQCIEAGADVDFDYLLTECAPLDALRQRFGRLDRLGELPACVDGEERAAILCDKAALKDGLDPIYGSALSVTWAWLTEGTRNRIDFGIDHLKVPEGEKLAPLLSPAASAPLLQRAYCDLFAQTSPEPVPSPDPAAFLHGVEKNDPEVQIVWRADLGDDRSRWADVVALCPPVASEAIAVRLSVARAWLESLASDAAPQAKGSDVDADVEGLAAQEVKASRGASKPAPKDADEDEDGEEAEEAEDAPEESRFRKGNRRNNQSNLPVLRWRGAEESEVADAGAIRPGDTLVVPCHYGGCDEFGWSPAEKEPVRDIAEEARARAGRARVRRLHPDLLTPDDALPFHDRLKHLKEEPEEGFRAFLRELHAEHGLPLPKGLRAELHPGGTGTILIEPTPEIQSTFEDADITSSRSDTSQRITLADHNADVGAKAREFATQAGLPPALVETVGLAGDCHDLGKADPRFQALLRGGNALAAKREGTLLAKSDRTPATREHFEKAAASSGWPKGARHELLSTRLVESSDALRSSVADPDLLLHLLASHHGRCRPFAPVVEDPEPLTVSTDHAGHRLAASSATGLERLGSGVSRRFFRLTRRYGWWGLAYLETLLRLADHRVSERTSRED